MQPPPFTYVSSLTVELSTRDKDYIDWNLRCLLNLKHNSFLTPPSCPQGTLDLLGTKAPTLYQCTLQEKGSAELRKDLGIVLSPHLFQVHL